MAAGHVPERDLLRHRPVPGWAELWQAPLFCLGLAALVTVLVLRPVNGTSPADVRAAYDQVLAALDQGDVAAARQTLQRILDLPQQETLTPTEVQFLKGSLLLADAHRQYPLPCTKSEGQALYRAALAELKEVATRSAKHPPPRLGYRLALAQAGSAPLAAPALDALEQSLDSNFTDRGEGYARLAELRAVLTPPDHAAAVRAIDQLLLIPGIARPHAWRLKKAEHLTHLGRWVDVQKTTAAIPSESEVHSQAAQLQAVAAYQRQQWGEAASLFAAVPPRQMTPRSLLFLGLCQQRLKQPTEAAAAWHRLSHDHTPTPEAVRAQVCLAELAFEQSNWRQAVRYLRDVLTTQNPAGFTNPYLPTEELHRLVQKVGERLIHLARWDDLSLLAEAAMPWGLKGQPDAWLARAWHALAETGASPLSKTQAYDRAADFALKAAGSLTGTEKQNLLYQAGRDALLANAPQKAQRALGELLALPPDPPLRPFVLIELADALYQQKRVADACDRLREAALLPGSHEAKARLRLARLFIQEKRLSEAELELEPAAALVTRPGAGPEAADAAHEWALFLYHDVVVLHSPRALLAINAGEKALVYAAQHPKAAQTRYLVGELLLAQAEAGKIADDLVKADKALLERRGNLLWQALQHLRAAGDDLTRHDAVLAFARTEVLRNVALGQADCLYHLGLLRQEVNHDAIPKRDACYQEAGRIYQEVAYKHERTVDGLYALFFLARCQKNRGEFTQARETLRDALQQLERMTEEQLAAPARTAQGRDRHNWERLLRSELDREP